MARGSKARRLRRAERALQALGIDLDEVNARPEASASDADDSAGAVDAYAGAVYADAGAAGAKAGAADAKAGAADTDAQAAGAKAGAADADAGAGKRRRGMRGGRHSKKRRLGEGGGGDSAEGEAGGGDKKLGEEEGGDNVEGTLLGRKRRRQRKTWQERAAAKAALKAARRSGRALGFQRQRWFVHRLQEDEATLVSSRGRECFPTFGTAVRRRSVELQWVASHPLTCPKFVQRTAAEEFLRLVAALQMQVHSYQVKCHFLCWKKWHYTDVKRVPRLAKRASDKEFRLGQHMAEDFRRAVRKAKLLIPSQREFISLLLSKPPVLKMSNHVVSKIESGEKKLELTVQTGRRKDTLVNGVDKRTQLMSTSEVVTLVADGMPKHIVKIGRPCLHTDPSIFPSLAVSQVTDPVQLRRQQGSATMLSLFQAVSPSSLAQTLSSEGPHHLCLVDYATTSFEAYLWPWTEDWDGYDRMLAAADYISAVWVEVGWARQTAGQRWPTVCPAEQHIPRLLDYASRLRKCNSV